MVGVLSKDELTEMKEALLRSFRQTRAAAEGHGGPAVMSDAQLRDTIEKRFIEERNKKLRLQERELEYADDPQAARLRHAEELRLLEEQKEKDFERYKHEREAGLATARKFQTRGASQHSLALANTAQALFRVSRELQRLSNK